MSNKWNNSDQQRYLPKITSRTYASLREDLSKRTSARVSENNPYTQRKVKEKIIDQYGGLGNGSQVIFQKQKDTMLSRYGVDNYFKLPEFKKSIAERNSKNWAVPDKKEKRIKNMKKGLAARPTLTCPHCSLQSKNNANMKRYHFDNCKLKR